MSLGIFTPRPIYTPLKRCFPTFYCRTFWFCCLPIFSSLELSHPFFWWPKGKQNSNRFWIDSDFLPQIGPDVPPWNGIRAWTALSIKNFFSWWSPHSSTFAPPNSTSFAPPISKKVHAISMVPHPPSFPWGRSRRHMNSVFSN